MSDFVKHHFRTIEAVLKAQANICQGTLPSYDIGLNREFFVREALRTHLPPLCEITAGSVSAIDREPSGQVDILLYHPLSLRINLGASDCCMAESVFSAIEVKSRLELGKFAGALRNLAAIRQLPRSGVYSIERGATTEGEAYHFNTTGTAMFGYYGYDAETCCDRVRQELGEDWPHRPEMIWCLEKDYLLVRSDYLRWEGAGVLRSDDEAWVVALKSATLDGYHVISEDRLLVFLTIITKRIQSNYSLVPVIVNYLA